MINERINAVLEILAKTYPHARIALNYSNPLELLVAVVLSAQCTDKMVNLVTEKLFKKYKSLEDFLKADLKVFEQDVKSTGFYHNKAKNILSSAKMVKEKFNGKIPQEMEDLLTLPGVARKTANIILGNAYGKIVGIAVDTHVGRISQRLRLVDLNKIGGKKKIRFLKGDEEIIDFVKDADAVKIEKELMVSVPQTEWFNITYRIIDHGRAVCKAQNPNCTICTLKKVCPVLRHRIP